MPELHIDLEVRSTIDLRTAGVHRYAVDESTEVLCAAVAANDGSIEIWTPGRPCPEVISQAVSEGWTLHAHNANFEMVIWAHILTPVHGWPEFKLRQWRCTMAAALAAALPGGLDAAAAALGLPLKKDREGHRLMLAMTKPRRVRKGEDPNAVYWHDDMERRLRLQDYCRNDVLVERELHRRLPPLSDAEQWLWEFDAAVNATGFHVDLELAQAAQNIVHLEQAAIDAEVTNITSGQVSSIDQVEKLTAYIKECGHDITALTKGTVATALARQLPDDVRRLLELRQQGAQAASRKLATLIASAGDDHRLRGTLRYHGASTGRWAGSRFQPQNLKKAKVKDLDAAIAAVRAGDLEAVRKLGAPLAVVGDLSRSMLCAAPGHVLYGADFSAVESRVLAWLADEKWKIKIYQDFDATGDPTLEPYCVTASHILKRGVTPEDEAGRAIGKLCDLAFGFGGGLGHGVVLIDLLPIAILTLKASRYSGVPSMQPRCASGTAWKGRFAVCCAPASASASRTSPPK